MNDLVIMKNKQAVTTSLEVAKAFGKKHKHVLETIENKIHSAENSAQYKMMFEESAYQDASGKSNKMYYMNRDGFTFIAMGFTGSKADKFKLKYINAFNQMEQIIRTEQALPKTPEELLKLAVKATDHLDERVSDAESGIKELKSDIKELKDESEIDSYQRYKLFKARQAKALKICGGKDSNYYRAKKGRKVFQELGHDLKERFTVTRYGHLKKKDFKDALDFIQGWYPSYNLKSEISSANSQLELLN